MTEFDLLLQQAKAAAFESVRELAGLELGDALLAVADAAYSAVDDLMPEADGLDQKWVLAMLGDRPDLLAMEADPGNLAAAIVGAVRDLIIDEIDADLLEHARNVGIDVPAALAP